ncbi:hypothetical protein ACFY9N_09730 [Microbacterium sp. NPDC008134]|uniref:hypothetical protein n=1 Tax=Microbacterium sp. NPDC008134 TaxID=3364183 RepID=UPI0036EBCAA9
MEIPPTAGSSRASQRTLLVGFGKLGARLAHELSGEGADVFALRRTDSELPVGATGIVADIASPLTRPLPDVDSVVITVPPSGAVGGYRSALENLARALPSPPRRTVFVSSTGVFEGAPSQPRLTERDEPGVLTTRARGLFEGEVAAHELFSAVVVRPAGIYGPGRDFLVRRVRDGIPVDHRRWTNRIHEVDLARAVHALLEMPDPPALLHAVDARPAPLGDVVRHVARRLAVDTPPDTGAEESGHVLDGTLLNTVLSSLTYPTYAEGYDAMLAPTD